VTWLKWKLVLVFLETVLILMQYRSMVCIEHTIVSEIILDAPKGTPGHVESRFGPFGDGVSVGAR
jgi:hypothetical protein